VRHPTHVRKRPEFERIQRGGERVQTARFVLIFARNPEAAAPARLGITASRKIGGAVVRNRAKRLVRAAFRQTLDLFAPGIDLVVIVRRSLAGSLLADVVAEWRGARNAVERRIAGLLAAAPVRTNTRV
jgi:ribonuclease P protein component